MAGGHQGFPQDWGHRQGSQEGVRHGLALLLGVVASLVWYRMAVFGGELLVLFGWMNRGADGLGTLWSSAPALLMMALMVATAPALLVLGAAALGHAKHAATIAELSFAAFATASTVLWLVVI